jgi:predicted ferric reductase
LTARRGQYLWRAAIGWPLLFLVVALVPLMLAWIGDKPGRGWPIELGIGLGLVGLGMLVVQAWTTGRQPRVATNFGADNLLHFHRHLGLCAVLMVLCHPIILFIAEPEYLRYLDPRADWLRAFALWGLSLALLVIVVSSYCRNLLGLSYEWWRLLHGALALLILVLGLGHALMVDHHLGEFWKQAVLVGLVGSAAWLILHSRLVRPMLLRRRPWTVTSVQPERGDAWTLTFEPNGHQGLNFESGQYAWFTLGETPVSMQQHPFSIACPAGTRQLCFSARAVGDFTGALGHIKPGTTAWIEGPYGSFVPDPDPATGLFLVAGGIGITPMMSMLRTFSQNGDKRPILLLYANPDLDQAAFAGELETLEHSLNLEVIHVLEDPPNNWRGESGFIDQDLIERHLGRLDDPVQYMTCGPDPLMDLVESVLRSNGVDWRRVFSERFEIV